ncbi:MAG: glycoside hydrolase [Treponema sp.]|jgi:alpha-D-xyloside xylohydrolase|nr:glycoside hydrolase [Treponema sp.]
MEKLIFDKKENAKQSFSFPGGEALLELRETDGESMLCIRLPYKAAYGTGERYDRVNRKGSTTVNLAEDHFCRQGARTYCPAPFFWTDSGFGFFADTQNVSVFDFGEEITIRLRPKNADAFAGVPIYLFAGSPAAIIAGYMSLFGPPRMIPRWALGPWMSANRWNTQAHVEEVLERLAEHRFPAAVLVLEAWSDEATFYIFNGASYMPKSGGESFRYEDFDFSQSPYWKDPRGMIEKLHNAGIRLVLWQIPAHKKQGPNDGVCVQRDNDRAWAAEQRLCVLDRAGNPYEIPEGKWFEGSLVPDFTNPEAARLWFEKRRYLLEIGVDGFKTDGGEFIYQDDTAFHNGARGAEMRNGYAQRYTAAYTAFLKDWQENQGEEKVLFSRAGYTGQHTTPLLWAGDQQSTFAELQSQLRAALSASLSGIIFWSFDIAGFAGPLPDAELYLRATALACFSPVMQWHSEPEGGQFGEASETAVGTNERSPWNIALTSGGGEPFLEAVRFWHQLRVELIPYIYEEALFCVENMTPLMRPLVYDRPFDEQCLSIEDEFMFGRSLLAAPVLEAGASSRRVYLPEGEWRDFFGDTLYQGGQWIEANCALRPGLLSNSPPPVSPPWGACAMPVFIKSGRTVTRDMKDKKQ